MGISENSLIHLCVERSTRVTKYLANICKVVSLFASVATGTKVVSLFASVATGTHAHDFAKLFQRTEMKIARAVVLLIFQLRCRHECFHNRRCSHSTLVGMLCVCPSLAIFAFTLGGIITGVLPEKPKQGLIEGVTWRPFFIIKTRSLKLSPQNLSWAKW